MLRVAPICVQLQQPKQMVQPAKRQIFLHIFCTQSISLQYFVQIKWLYCNKNDIIFETIRNAIVILIYFSSNVVIIPLFVSQIVLFISKGSTYRYV